jgi:L-glyceraldehyde 3-phosphate reductase
MQYRRVGKWGLRLPEISLGLWHNFGGTAPLERSREIVRRAFELGITHFDLANNYGPPYGSAEETFGQILRKDLAGHRDEIVVSTKAGWDMWPGPYGDGAAPPRVPSRSCLLDRADVGAVDREPLHQRNFVCGSPSAGSP